ncbi:MAG: ABC transporter permease [Acidobacteriaceae bacterium]|nr:ABC transporter permease [Acidobacteriaceae bacterium]
MVPLARRNLLHDRTRFLATVAGIAFAIVLVIVQLGLFLGFTQTTSGVIDHSGADLWVMARGVQYFEVGFPVSERKLYRILSAPGVEGVQRCIVQFAAWQRPDGARKNVEVIGFEAGALGGPWNVTSGSAAELAEPNTVMPDEFYGRELGAERVGDTVEINGVRARVVGFTRGIRSFTTTPFIFTSFKNALDYTHLEADRTVFLLVRGAAGTDGAELKREVEARVPDLAVYTRDEFARRTRNYWLFTTGAGIALLVAAMLGLLVGAVVVAQTIYAITVDHERDYGMLKAMGASNGFVCGVILKQAAMSGIAGYAAGMGIGLAIVRLSRAWGAVILAPWQLAAAMLGLALAMCCGASIVSMQRVLRLEPATVFKD